jgi:SNF2 family DNA or RNA helicase
MNCNTHSTLIAWHNTCAQHERQRAHAAAVSVGRIQLVGRAATSACCFFLHRSFPFRLCTLDEENLNCCVSDEMGLGKTIQCMSFIAHLFDNRRRGPHLIVVPGSTLDNWLREFEKWLPDMTVGNTHSCNCPPPSCAL